MPDLDNPISILDEGTSEVVQHQEKELGQDYQRFISDPEPINKIFKMYICNWQINVDEIETTILGVTSKEQVETWNKTAKNKIGNEDLANETLNAIAPLISQLCTTSKLDVNEIYNQWNMKVIGLLFTIADNYFKEGNTFEFNPDRLLDYISFIGNFHTFTCKAKDGFTLKELVESFQTFIAMHSNPLPEKKKGVFDIFRGGK